MIMIETIKKTR